MKYKLVFVNIMIYTVPGKLTGIETGAAVWLK